MASTQSLFDPEQTEAASSSPRPQKIGLTDFLRLASTYGAGLFNLPLARLVLQEPASLDAWISSHPHHVDCWGEPGHWGLYKLTTAGHRAFGTTTMNIQAQNFYSLLDAFLFTAYQFEKGEFSRAFLRGHARLNLPSGERVGIFSARYGLPPCVDKLDTLLVLPESRERVVAAQLWALGTRQPSVVSRVRVVTPQSLEGCPF
jgi:hypothetical protein